MTFVFIQARLGSSRLPNKSLLPLLDNLTVLDCIYNRCRLANVDDVIVCTTTSKHDEEICIHCKNNDYKFFCGSENDVLDRFFHCANLLNAQTIIRITCDCPFIDFKIINAMLYIFLKKKLSFYSMEYSNGSHSFPDGFDVEIMNFSTLKTTYLSTDDVADREHVTPYMKKNFAKEYFKLDSLKQKFNFIDYSNLHLSLDTFDDYVFIQNIFKHFNNNFFDISDILNYLDDRHFIENKDGKESKNKGQILYQQAKNIISGGNQFLSKRPEMFLPDLWPAYYQTAKGIEVTTLDGEKLLDFGYMAIGACSIGYSNEEINKAVIKSVERGTVSTLNSPNEVLLAKKLCSLHPWAQSVRYARTSGEACSMAIRIARAFTKKDKVAFCGYHGWHDWYLSANLNSQNSLDNHLISGLSTDGVPSVLKNTAFPFRYNNLDELLDIIKNHDIGTIIMEPMRSEKPKNNFLENIRKLCDEKNIILIFDEVSSGFRVNNGGLHLTFNVIPDIAVFGKALGNGFPISAIIGKKFVMDMAQQTFMSSTNWSEDIGLSAGIAVIDFYLKYDVANYLNELGIYFRSKLQSIIDLLNMNITISGLNSMLTFTFNYPKALVMRTIFTKLMLENGIIAKNSIYLSFSHNKKNIDYYLDKIQNVFHYLNKNYDILENLIETPLAHTGFARLT